ncbi:Alba, DNA/RNA-binding protein, partial [mine drainage metagenome]
VVVKARGNVISRAVDVVEIVRRRYLENQVTVGTIQIDTERLVNREGREMNVSSITIPLSGSGLRRLRRDRRHRRRRGRRHRPVADDPGPGEQVAEPLPVVAHRHEQEPDRPDQRHDARGRRRDAHQDAEIDGKGDAGRGRRPGKGAPPQEERDGDRRADGEDGQDDELGGLADEARHESRGGQGTARHEQAERALADRPTAPVRAEPEV